jgi:prevent-host-death family protein
MATVSATDAKNKIGELWAMAEEEPVTIERNGVARYQLISTESYVAVPRAEYDRLKSTKRIPQFGFAKEYFKGFDSDALLAVDVSAEFENSL